MASLKDLGLELFEGEGVGSVVVAELPVEAERMDVATNGFNDYLFGDVSNAPGNIDRMTQDVVDKLGIGLLVEAVDTMASFKSLRRIKAKAMHYLASEDELDAAIARGDREGAGRILSVANQQLDKGRTFVLKAAAVAGDRYPKPAKTEATQLLEQITSLSKEDFGMLMKLVAEPERLRQLVEKDYIVQPAE
jgi:hypothetical protein